MISIPVDCAWCPSDPEPVSSSLSPGRKCSRPKIKNILNRYRDGQKRAFKMFDACYMEPFLFSLHSNIPENYSLLKRKELGKWRIRENIHEPI